jgi:hypothetical protein
VLINFLRRNDMRYQGKKPKKSKNIPPLHEFAEVTVGTVKKELVSGYTVTREEFKSAVEETFRALHTEPWHAIPEDVLAKVREIITPTVEGVDRFPLGTWMDTERGCGCIIGEALVANDVINRHLLMAMEAGQRIEEIGVSDVGDLLKENYPEPLAEALLYFGQEVDTKVARLVRQTCPDGTYWPEVKTGTVDRWGDPIYADRIVFIEDPEEAAA